MATVQEWVDSIRMDVAEPLDPTVARQVRYALQEFFRASESWLHAESIEIASDTVPLGNMPDETYVASTKHAYFERENGSGRLKLISELAHRITPSSIVSTFSHSGNSILLNSFEKGTLEVSVVVQPTRNIDVVPDSLGDKWFDVIRRGAMARLLSMPHKSWTNSRAALAYEEHFREGIGKAKREARDDRSRPKRSVKFNRGFAW